MFKCKVGHNTLPKEKCHRVPIQTRVKEYLIPVIGEEDIQVKIVVGSEIVEEANFCEKHVPREES